MRFWILWLLLANSILAISQPLNLVLNGSFEEIESCPVEYGQLSKAIGWHSPSDGTPDLYSSCDPSNFVGVPLNSIGYEYAHHGENYAGVFCYDNLAEVREYIQQVLTSPLVQGKRYFLSYSFSMSDKSQYKILNLGVVISSDSTYSTTTRPIIAPLAAIKLETGASLGRIGWYTTEDQFIAHGGEQYITIGNFNYDADTDTVFEPLPDSGMITYAKSYYYIDDIHLECMEPEGCDDIGIKTIDYKRFKCYPNPARDRLFVGTGVSEGIITIEVIDITGRKCLSKEFNGEPIISLTLNLLQPGFYVLRVSDSLKLRGIEKFNKIE